MFQPVGSQPPSVYWRRRLVFLGTLLLLVVLLVVTARVLFSGDGEAAPPAGSGGGSGLSNAAPSTHPQTSSTSGSTSGSTPSGTTSSGRSGSAGSSGSSSTASAPPPKPCKRSDLQLQAVTDHTSYSVGDKPKLMLQVTNTGSASCVQDLADKQVELRVYNGESRVWGSHDCLVQPGTNDVTLVPRSPVRVTIIWSGLSSRENTAHTQDACGPRQVVGAGTYTLYPYLGGKPGHASQFSIN